MQSHLIMDYEKYRNPARQARVIIVATLFTLLGLLGGALISLFLGALWLWMPLSALISGYFGAKIELGSALFNSDEKSDKPHDSQPPKSR